MIASGGPCYQDRLVRLLNSQLSTDEEESITSHLDHCRACREALNELTGPSQLWEETREVLSESTELGMPFENSRIQNSPSQDDTAHWVKTLLKPCDDTSMLGLLDGRAVQAIIGQGGMGVVLKVWDAELHRPLAVKLLSPMLATTGTARQRFFREAQAAAAVVHPNIVPIYAVTSEGPLPYIVMPLVGGGSLQQRIEREGPLGVIDVLSIGLQIAEGLSAAHRQGLVHRDIKPANILLDAGGHRVMLSDFGLARALDDASMTASGMIAGTPNYMSPEQARGETVDARSDIYSLGAVLYTMATGHPPVRGDTALAVLRRVTDEQPRMVHAENETMPVWLDRVVGRFLAKDANRRLGSAEAAADLLRGCLAHLRAPARIALPVEIAKPRTFLRRIGIAAVVLLTFTAGFGLAWTTRQQLQVPHGESPPKSAFGTTLSANATAFQLIDSDSEFDSKLEAISMEIESLNKELEFE